MATAASRLRDIAYVEPGRRWRLSARPARAIHAAPDPRRTDATAGCVLVDGRCGTVDRIYLRRVTAMVLQETVFHCTIRDNIRYAHRG